MASSYDITTGSGVLEIGGVNPSDDYVGVQVTQTELDNTITLKLMQTEDGVQYHDLPQDPIQMATVVSSALLQSKDFNLSKLFLDIDVGSATTGTLTIYATSR